MFYFTVLEHIFVLSGDTIIHCSTDCHVPQQTSDGSKGRSVITQQTLLWCSITGTRDGWRISQ